MQCLEAKDDNVRLCLRKAQSIALVLSHKTPSKESIYNRVSGCVALGGCETVMFGDAGWDYEAFQGFSKR